MFRTRSDVRLQSCKLKIRRINRKFIWRQLIELCFTTSIISDWRSCMWDMRVKNTFKQRSQNLRRRLATFPTIHFVKASLRCNWIRCFPVYLLGLCVPFCVLICVLRNRLNDLFNEFLLRLRLRSFFCLRHFEIPNLICTKSRRTLNWVETWRKARRKIELKITFYQKLLAKCF